MDVVDHEAYSFLKQQIVRHIHLESNRLGLQPLSQGVVDAVCQHCHQGTHLWNHSFCTLVVCSALSIHIAQF